MNRESYFELHFQEKCRYIKFVRERLYDADTKEERDAAVPMWLLHMLQSFEYRYNLNRFTSLLLGSFLYTSSLTMDEEFVYILDEIHEERLHRTLYQMELLGLLWNKPSSDTL